VAVAEALTAERRLIAVLGYSPRRSDRLHPICSARVDRACAIARKGDRVVLSGWSRHPGIEPEAELMARAWTGAEVDLLLERDARHTVGNAEAVAEVALASGAREVVLVTSWWHNRRASALVRAALRGTGIGVTAVAAPSHAPRTLLLRELCCLAALPAQLAWLKRRPPIAGRTDNDRVGAVIASGTASGNPACRR
jgi:uncharacterized SAM-binding protein YcdF (DUF218 family)